MKITYSLIEYMPEHLRASHVAARNSGTYPHNGAQRVYVEGEISASQLHPEWAEVISDGLLLSEIPEQDREDILAEIPTDALAPVRDLDDEEACRADYLMDEERDWRLTHGGGW